MNKNFISQMQKRVAVTAIGPSVVRGLKKGTIKVVRDFLESLPLRGIPCKAKPYGAWLERQTQRLMKENVPISWGVARKCLNLFLRDALYNRYLCEHYALDALEDSLEVPLDGVVGRLLIQKARQDGKPWEHGPWPGLIGLDRKYSRALQDVAAETASEERRARVHQDLWLWTNNRRLPNREGR